MQQRFRNERRKKIGAAGKRLVARRWQVELDRCELPQLGQSVGARLHTAETARTFSLRVLVSENEG